MTNSSSIALRYVGEQAWIFFFFNFIFIWLCRVLVVAGGLLSCGM